MKRIQLFFLALAMLGVFCISLPQEGLCAAAQNGDARKARQNPDWPPNIRFLTGPTKGQWFQMGEIIALLLNEHVVPTTSRSGGGLANISSINDKMGDFGFTVSSFLISAQNKVPEFSQIKVDNVALIGDIFPQILYFLVRKEFAEKHGITTVKDLVESSAQVRMASLRPGSASEFIVSLLFKYGYNTSFDALREKGWTLMFGNYAEISDSLVSGRLDCFAYTAGADVPLIRTMEEYIPIQILDVDASALATFAEKFGMYPFVIPQTRFASLTKPVQTLGDFSCIVVRKDLPEDMVYEVTRQLYTRREIVGTPAATADFAEWRPETAIAHKEHLHPGALRFWEEQLQK